MNYKRTEDVFIENYRGWDIIQKPSHSGIEIFTGKKEGCFTFGATSIDYMRRSIDYYLSKKASSV